VVVLVIFVRAVKTGEKRVLNTTDTFVWHRFYAVMDSLLKPSSFRDLDSLLYGITHFHTVLHLSH
jgi:hypothetical protein